MGLTSSVSGSDRNEGRRLPSLSGCVTPRVTHRTLVSGPQFGRVRSDPVHSGKLVINKNILTLDQVPETSDNPVSSRPAAASPE